MGCHLKHMTDLVSVLCQDVMENDGVEMIAGEMSMMLLMGESEPRFHLK